MAILSGDKLSQKHFYDLLRKRDKKAMELLYDHYVPVMYGIVMRIVRNEDLAEKVLTRAFRYIWKNYREFDPDKQNVCAWVINVTRRMCGEEVPFVEFTQYLNEPAVITPMDKSKLSISGLPSSAKSKKVFELLFFGNGSVSQVAKHAGMSVAETKRSLKEALEGLRFVSEKV